MTAVFPFFNCQLPLAPVFIEIDYKKISLVDKFNQKIKSKGVIDDMNIDTISVIPLVREYIQGLEKVHLKFRELTFDLVVENCKLIYSKVKEQYGDVDYEKVAYIKKDNADKFVEGVLIQIDYLKKTLELRQKSISYNKSQFFIDKKALYNVKNMTVKNCESITIKYNC